MGWWTGVMIGAIFLVGVSLAQQMRTWTDVSGKYKVQAKFVQMSDGKVVLECADGKRVSVPLDKLCEADRKYVADLEAEANPFQEVTPARPKGRQTMPAPEEAEGQQPEAPGEPKTVSPRWAQAQQLLPTASQEPWKLSITPPETSAGGRNRALPLPPKTDFFERIQGIVVNPACQRAVIGYMLEKPGPHSEGRTRLVLCDLAVGKVLGSANAPEKMAPLALDDTGTKVVMRREEFGFGKQDQLEIWSLKGSAIQRLLRWIPHDDVQGPERDVKWAAFAGPDKLLTLGGGKLTVWNAATAQPLYWVKSQGGCIPALSPDRKYVAFATDKEVGILDLEAGNVAAFQAVEAPQLPFPVFAFTPNGSRLVCAAFDRIYVWETATGNLAGQMLLAGMNLHVGSNLVCPAENYALVGKTLLVDLVTQAKVWTYQGHEAVTSLGNVCWFVVATHDAGALVAATLPHPTAKQRMQQAMAAPDFFIFKPGVTVRINVSGLTDPAEREKVAAVLREKLIANGCHVGENGTVELVATTEAGKQREVGYHVFGQIGTRIYNVQEYLCRLKLVWQGQTAWEVTGSNVPGFIQLKEGETIQDVLRRSERPNYAWFAHVELPKMVQKPSAKGGTLGASQVTITGIQ